MELTKNKREGAFSLRAKSTFASNSKHHDRTASNSQSPTLSSEARGFINLGTTTTLLVVRLLFSTSVVFISKINLFEMNGEQQEAGGVQEISKGKSIDQSSI